MAWPHPPDYNEAVQNPRFCFRDPELKAGHPALNPLGLPWPRSGNHADVYKLECSNNQTWAVKCFTREVHGLRPRYQAVSDHLKQAVLPAMVDFEYQEEGILIHGRWYPIVKMRWVEGQTLNELVKEHIDKPLIIERLAQLWLRLAQEMRAARITHGDLQHGNVLLIPGGTPGTLRLRLVDYDGMFVPALAQTQSGEVGHPNYQHPQRLREGTYDAEVDRFSHLVIYTALRCLALGGRDLWERHDNAENLLFRERDFQDPASSKLFHELNDISDPDVWALVGHLALAASGPLTQVPLLEEVVTGGRVKALDEKQQRRVEQGLSGSGSESLSPFQLLPPEPEPTKNGSGHVTLKLKHSDQETLTATASQRRWRGPIAPAPVPKGVVEAVAGSAVFAAKELNTWATKRLGWHTAAIGIACAVIGLVTFAIMVGMVLWFALGMADADERHPGPPPPPPRQVLRGPLLKPGHTQSVQVTLSRHDYAGPVELAVENLPSGIRARFLERDLMADGATLELTAAPETMIDETTITLVAQAGNRRLGRQSVPLAVVPAAEWSQRMQHSILPGVTLTVDAPPVARLAPLPDTVVKAGKTQALQVRIDRNGCDGQLSAELGPLPVGVKSRPIVVPNQPDVLAFELSAGTDAADAVQQVEVRARLDEEPLAPGIVLLKVQSQKPARLVRPEDLTVQAGEKQTLKVSVERDGYEGPIDVQLNGLPKGVTAKPATIAPDEDSVTVELQVEAGADAGEKVVEVWAWVVRQQAAKQALMVTVMRPPPKEPPKSEEPVRETITFKSADGVHLVGTWYASDKKGAAPCVLLLHQLGGHRKQEGWHGIALALQRQGYAVFAFDFRGHGESTKVDPAFWTEDANKLQIKRGTQVKGFPENILARQFEPRYWPTLANDIAAARLVIERKNEAEECNGTRVFVVGAQEGATLGAMWLYSEWYRFSMVQAQPFQLNLTPEGRGITGAVWLNISPTLADRKVRLIDWLKIVGSEKKMPMIFLHGDRDKVSTAFARECLAEVRPNKINLRLTTAEPVPAATVAGEALLRHAPTEVAINGFLDRVQTEHPAPRWSRRQTDRRAFYWNFPRAQNPIPAKRADDTVMRLLPADSLANP